MKLDLDDYHTRVVEEALLEYAKHVFDPIKKRDATDVLGMIQYAKRSRR